MYKKQYNNNFNGIIIDYVNVINKLFQKVNLLFYHLCFILIILFNVHANILTIISIKNYTLKIRSVPGG